MTLPDSQKNTSRQTESSKEDGSAPSQAARGWPTRLFGGYGCVSFRTHGLQTVQVHHRLRHTTSVHDRHDWCDPKQDGYEF